MSAIASYMTRDDLAALLQAPSGRVAIIDVRDDDYVGGHIKGSQNVPSSALDYRLPELVRTLKDKEKVVFHCALSQQRGPKAARRYLEERDRMSNAVDRNSKSSTPPDDQIGSSKSQQVYILQGGFTQWQEKYGSDKLLTEDYAADIWEYGY